MWSAGLKGQVAGGAVTMMHWTSNGDVLERRRTDNSRSIHCFVTRLHQGFAGPMFDLLTPVDSSNMTIGEICWKVLVLRSGSRPLESMRCQSTRNVCIIKIVYVATVLIFMAKNL